MIRIAIDGPGGAGKSSVAKSVAKKLGIIYVDTGALYRTIGVFALSRGIDPKDEDGVKSILADIKLELKFIDGKQVIMLNDNAVGDEIRTPEASMAASAVSALGPVREFLLMTQRNIAEQNSVIMDGRDIGTVILPSAEVKIFLTASPEARAKRRYDELTAKGITTTYEAVFNDMAERDKNDSTRALAPCVPAKDAITLDNSLLTAEETVNAVIDIVENAKKKLNKRFTLFYKVVRIPLKIFIKLFMRVRFIGEENLNASNRRVIVASNHIGIRDVFLMGISYPCQLYFLSKVEWFKVPVLKHIVKALGAIPLDRGGKDVRAIKNAVEAINNGKTLAIFPQGHRFPGVNPSETPIKSGIGLIAYHSHADVIPVCIKTKDVKYKFLRRIDVIYGKPIKFEDLGFLNGGVAEYRNATSIVFDEICRLGGYSQVTQNSESGSDGQP